MEAPDSPVTAQKQVAKEANLEAGAAEESKRRHKLRSCVVMVASLYSVAYAAGALFLAGELARKPSTSWHVPLALIVSITFGPVLIFTTMLKWTTAEPRGEPSSTSSDQNELVGALRTLVEAIREIFSKNK